MQTIRYPAYQIKSFGKVVEITEDSTAANNAYDGLWAASKELWRVEANGMATCLRRELS